MVHFFALAVAWVSCAVLFAQLESVAAVDAATFHRQLLLKYPDRASVDETYQRSCRNPNDSKLKSPDCADLKYLASVYSKVEYLKSVKTKSYQVTVNDPSSNLRYNQIFQDYILKQLPYIGRSLSSEAVIDCVREFVDGKIDLVAEDVSLRPCQHRQDISVPSILQNNYLFKLHDHSVGSPSRSRDVETLHIKDHWPAVLPLQPGKPTRVLECPMKLHQLIVNTASVAVKIRMFSVAAAMEFDPRLAGKELLDPSADATAVARPLHHTNSYSLSGFPKLFDKNPNDKKKVYSLPKYTDVVLGMNEYIMLPNSVISSFLIENGGSDPNAKHGMLRYCFADASNVNQLRHELALTAAVSAYNGGLLEQLRNRTTLEMDISPDDDRKIVDILPGSGDSAPNTILTEMLQQPQLQQEQQQPQDPQAARARPASRRRGSSEVSNAGTRAELETGSSPTPSNAVGWQDTKRWQGLIQSLVLPSPVGISVVHASRNNVTFAVKSDFVKDRNDATKFGIELQICPVNVTIDETQYFQHPQCVVTELLMTGWDMSQRGVLKEFEQAEIDSLLASQSLSVAELGSTWYKAVTGDRLEPNSLYRGRGGLLLGEARSNPSPWSPVFSTADLTVPTSVPTLTQIKRLLFKGGSSPSRKSKKEPRITNLFLDANKSVVASTIAATGKVLLQVTRPFDDGGSPILRYAVRGRYSDHDSFPRGWIMLESALAEVDNSDSSRVGIYPLHFLGNVSMEFQVAAVNAVGIANWSETSNSVVTPAFAQGDGRKLVMAGIGGGHAEVIATIDTWHQKLNVSTASVATAAQVIGWSCHWGPKTEAIGVATWAQPLLADGPLQGGEGELTGKIVFSLRGAVPLAHKVTRIQVGDSFH
jgi:hypothetical protein